VVFGRDGDSFPATLAPSDLDGTTGFVLQGADGEQAGYSVSGAGDLNGDGIDDLLIGATGANSEAGRTYVVFGSATSFGSSLSLASLDGSNGFIIEGIGIGDQAGYSVSGAGDLNGDGVSDLVIGAPIRDGNTGAAYVVFGRDGKESSFAGTLELEDLGGSDGFMIEGVEEGDYLGWSVSDAGDLNDDGISDLILGAYGANKAYVVFGDANGFGSSLSLSDLDGTNGFVLEGANGDWAGYSVSSAGDYNGEEHRRSADRCATVARRRGHSNRQV
jgi:FG-GAP repeat.